MSALVARIYLVRKPGEWQYGRQKPSAYSVVVETLERVSPEEAEIIGRITAAASRALVEKP